MESTTLAVSTTSTEAAVHDNRRVAVFNGLHAPTGTADRRLCLDDNDNDGRMQQQLMRDVDDEEEIAEEERLLMVLSEVRRAYSLLCDNVYGRNGGSEFIRRLQSYSDNTSRSNAHDCADCSPCSVTREPSSSSSSHTAAAAAALGLDRHADALNHNGFLGLQSAPPAMSRDLSTQSDIYSNCSDHWLLADSSRQGVFRPDSSSPSLHASSSTTCCTTLLQQLHHDPRRPIPTRCCRSVSVPPFLRPIEEEEWSSGGEETGGGPSGRGDRVGGSARRPLLPGSITGVSSSSSNADDFARNEYYLTYSAVAASVGNFDAESPDGWCPCGGLATVCLCPEPADEQPPQLEFGSLASSCPDDTVTSQLDPASTNSIDVIHLPLQHSSTSGSDDDLMTSSPTTCDVSESSNNEVRYNSTYATLTDDNCVPQVRRTSEMTSEVASRLDYSPWSVWLDDQPHLFYVLLTTSATFAACLTAVPPSCLVTLVAFMSLIGFRIARL